MMRYLTLTALSACLSCLPLTTFAAPGNTVVPFMEFTPSLTMDDAATFASKCPEASTALTPLGALVAKASLTMYETAEPAFVIVTSGNAELYIEIAATDIPEIVKGFTAHGGWLVVMPLSASDAEVAASYTPAPIGKFAIFALYDNGQETPQGCDQLSGFQPLNPDDLIDLPPALASGLLNARNQAEK